MKILECFSNVYNRTMFIPKDAYETLVTKGKKDDKGRKLGEVLDLSIKREFEKNNLYYEEKSYKNRMYMAEYLANECTSPKRLKEWSSKAFNMLELSECDLRTHTEQDSFNKIQDAWIDKQCIKMKIETAHHPKASSVILGRFANGFI